MKKTYLKFLSALGAIIVLFPAFCQAGTPNIPDPSFYRREPPGGYVSMFLLTPLGNRLEIVWRIWENVDIDADTILSTRLLRKALKARGAKDASLRIRDEVLKSPGCTITVNAGSDFSRVRSGILYSVVSCTGATEERAPTPSTDVEFLQFADFIVEQVGKTKRVPQW